MNARDPLSLTAQSKATWIEQNLKAGEIYAGLILGHAGAADYHLILLAGEGEKLSWQKAKEFAAKAGGELPTRREQALLFANLKQEFKSNWYWSGEQHASGDDCAWTQYFYYGDQHYYSNSAQLRARAVRRLEI